MRSLVTVDDLSLQERMWIIGRAQELRTSLGQGSSIEPTLSGTTVANLFFEPSTRTQLSFDLAAQRLGAHVLNLNLATSSTSKGESLRDTVETVRAIGADVLVVRNGIDGTIGEIDDWVEGSVVNAGEGTSAHPTQALLDAVTLMQHFGTTEGLSVGIVGDIAHSRVAASLSRLLPSLGAQVVQIGPREFVSETLNLDPHSDLDQVLPALDVVYLLRVQKERGAELPADYVNRFQLNRYRYERMRATAVVMHPGPVNRDVEIESKLLGEERCLVLAQVSNGVPTRMSVLEWALG